MSRLTDAMVQRLMPVQEIVPPSPRSIPGTPRPYRALGLGVPYEMAQADLPPSEEKKMRPGVINAPAPEPQYTDPNPKTVQAPSPQQGMKLDNSLESLGGNYEDAQHPSGNSTAAHELQNDLLHAEKQYDRLRYIQSLYKPDMLNKNRIFQQWMNNQKDAWGGRGVVGTLLGSISPQEKDELEKYAVWRQAAIGAINDYVHDMTGAQLGEKEADRLRAAQPNPGIGSMYGMFDADSPTVYQAKIAAQMRYLRRSISRASYYAKIGVPYAKHLDEMEKTMPLFTGEFDPTTGDWKKAIIQRVQELKSRGKKDNEIAPVIIDEFGLDQGTGQGESQ